MILSEHKKANMFQAKRLIKRWVPVTSNRCPDHLSRQFLTTASTFPYSSKNSSAEHIHALSTWLTMRNTLTHSHRQTHTLTHINTHTHTHTLLCTRAHTHTHSSAEHILALTTWLTITNKLTHIDTHTYTHTHTHSPTHSQTHTDALTLTHTAICIKMLLSTWLTITNALTHIDKHTHSLT